MKKIFCDIRMFELHQRVYVVEDTTDTKECVAITNIDELPAVISAICDEKQVYQVYLSGNSVFGQAVAEDIIAYSKQNYSWNNIEIEVIK